MMSQVTKRNFHTYLNFLIPECINATIKKLQIKAIKIIKKQGVIDPEKQLNCQNNFQLWGR